MFSVTMHIPPHRLPDLSVIQMINHVQYLQAERGSDG
jgi:hypothetical protein